MSIMPKERIARFVWITRFVWIDRTVRIDWIVGINGSNLPGRLCLDINSFMDLAIWYISFV